MDSLLYRCTYQVEGHPNRIWSPLDRTKSYWCMSALFPPRILWPLLQQYIASDIQSSLFSLIVMINYSAANALQRWKSAQCCAFACFRRQPFYLHQSALQAGLAAACCHPPAPNHLLTIISCHTKPAAAKPAKKHMFLCCFFLRRSLSWQQQQQEGRNRNPQRLLQRLSANKHHDALVKKRQKA